MKPRLKVIRAWVAPAHGKQQTHLEGPQEGSSRYQETEPGLPQVIVPSNVEAGDAKVIEESSLIDRAVDKMVNSLSSAAHA